MAIRMVVRVDASRSHQDEMTVQDAFAHVLDLFDLATSGSGDIGWRLVAVSMQSPLTVTAEAFGTSPNVDVAKVAGQRKSEFVRNYRELSRGRMPLAWSKGAALTKTKEIIERNRDGIGTTLVRFEEGNEKVEQVELNKESATAVIEFLGEVANDPKINTKEQHGSIDGTLFGVTTWRHQPAIVVRERKTGNEVWCIVHEEFRKKISSEANFNDVWGGHRVRIRGRILYDKKGAITRVYTTEIHRVDPPPVSVEDLKDATFTNGMSVAEYLEKFREGELG